MSFEDDLDDFDELDDDDEGPDKIDEKIKRQRRFKQKSSQKKFEKDISLKRKKRVYRPKIVWSEHFEDEDYDDYLEDDYDEYY